MSIFEVIPGLKEETEKAPEDKIAITKVKFISQELSTYEELFRGFNEIRVITYSYALSFIEKIMHYFDHGEVIIGFDKMINNKTAELFALQEYSTNYVCKNTYLQERINNDEFRFFVLNDLVSHQKVYLLKADDGRVRTITGSANFSERAWNGDQIECVTVCDDLKCYEVYASQYETLQRFSTDEISKNAVPIEKDGENADELPIFKRIEKENAVVLHDVQDEEEVIRIVDEVIDYIKSTGLNYYVGPCETSIEGDYDTLMEIVKNCQLVAAKAGCKAMNTYVKISYKAEGDVLTIDKKVTKHHQ